ILADQIFEYLRNQMLESPDKWKSVSARMKKLFDEFPEFNPGERQSLLAGFEAWDTAKPAEPDSVEAQMLRYALQPRRRDDDDEENDARKKLENEIVFRGYDAIQPLIDMIGDPRITTHERPSPGSAPRHVKTVGELALELIQEITGKDERAFFRAR